MNVPMIVRVPEKFADLNPFKPRPGEVLIGGELIDRKIGDETVSDIALRPQEDARSTYWVIDKVRLARKSTLRRRPSYRLVDFDEVPALFDAPTAMQAEAARLRDVHPGLGSEVAHVLAVVFAPGQCAQRFGARRCRRQFEGQLLRGQAPGGRE